MSVLPKGKNPLVGITVHERSEGCWEPRGRLRDSLHLLFPTALCSVKQQLTLSCARVLSPCPACRHRDGSVRPAPAPEAQPAVGVWPGQCGEGTDPGAALPQAKQDQRLSSSGAEYPEHVCYPCPLPTVPCRHQSHDVEVSFSVAAP